MGKIIKQKWGIIGPIDLYPFYLRQNILPSDYIKFDLVDCNDDTLEYIGEINYLWKIVLSNHLVKGIYYRKKCPFPNINFWDMHFDSINSSLSEKYKMLKDGEDFKGPVLYIVYRDYFVSLIGILDGNK